MTALAELLVPLGGMGLVVAAAVFLRVGAAAFALPGIGEQAVPVRFRLVLALGISLAVAPAVAGPVLAAWAAAPAAPAFLLAEAAAGLVMGLGLRVAVGLLQLAAAKAAQATSLAQVLGPGATPDPMPAIGVLLVTGGLALAFATGLHVHIIAALIVSYDVLPPGAALPGGDLAAWGTGLMSAAFGLAFSLAAPFLILALLYNVALGAINRAMPQLMVALVGAPALTFGALVVLLLAAPLILPLWRDHLFARLASPLAVLP